MQMRDRAVVAVCLNANGSRGLSVDTAGALLIWESSGATPLEAGGPGRRDIRSVAIDGAGATAVSAGDALMVWDLNARRRVRNCPLEPDHTIAVVRMTANGRYVIGGTTTGMTYVWDLADGRRVALLPASGQTAPRGDGNAIKGAAMTPDGSIALTMDTCLVLRSWNLGTTTCVGATDFGALIRRVLPGQERLQQQADTLLWNTRVWAVGKIELGLGALISLDNNLAWFCVQGTPRKFTGHEAAITAVAITPSPLRVVSCDKRGQLHVWAHQPDTPWASYTMDTAFTCCAISADGRVLLAGDGNGQVHYLNLEPSSA